MLLKILAAAFAHKFNRNTGSVRSNKRAGLSVFIEIFKNLFFDVQTFNYNFNNPVRSFHFGYIIFQISCRNSICEIFVIEWGRIAFYGFLKIAVNNSISNNFIFQGKSLFLFIIGKLAWNNVQQQNFNADVCEMAGNTASHNSGTNYRYFVNSSF